MDATAQFASLLAEHQDRIYRICCCYVRDRDERCDVHQTVLIHLWQGLGSFQGASSLGTWVYRVTVNTCLMHLRSEQRRQKAHAEAGRQPEAPSSAGPADDDGAPGDAAVERLYACVQELPPVDRALVSLYLEDAGTRQIAEVLGISEANVRVRLHRARKRLKAIWEGRSDGAG
jgi:RNA polymerase sigma-70 factor (ECF subfamily)